MINSINKAIFFILLFTIIICNSNNAQVPTLLKTSVGNINSMDNEIIGNTFYFKLDASTGFNEKQLWKTDGTPGGTQLVKDSFYYDVVGLSNINDTLYFISQTTFNSNAPLALWKSDGTDAGTTIVKIFPGLVGVGFLTVINNICYFRLDNGIWKTDGTDAGTVQIMSGLIGGTLFYPVDNGVAFVANVAGSAYQSLWKTDGTTLGTVMLVDSVAFPAGGKVVTSPTVSNGNLYFWIANQGKLWKTDGTVSGTSHLATIANVSNLTAHNNKLYFSAFATSPLGWYLWESDGTVSGTVQLPGFNNVKNTASMGGSLYLDGKALYESEPQKSDGTFAGTTLLKDINVGTTGSTPQYFTTVMNQVFFQANDGIYGTQIWKTDGTGTGTTMAYSTADTITALATVVMIPFNNYLLFIHGTGTTGDLYSILATSTSAPLQAPINLMLTPQFVQVTGQMMLDWTDNSTNEDGFIIERSLDGNTWSFVATSISNNYTDAGLADATLYYYRVAAYNTTDTSAYSNVVSGTTLATGVSTITNEELIVIFPNPAKDMITVSLPMFNNSAQLKIMNNLGQEVLSKQIFGTIETIDISQLTAGAYFVKIKNGAKIYTQRIIIR